MDKNYSFYIKNYLFWMTQKILQYAINTNTSSKHMNHFKHYTLFSNRILILKETRNKSHRTLS